jgi:hypothetical protein
MPGIELSVQHRQQEQQQQQQLQQPQQQPQAPDPSLPPPAPAPEPPTQLQPPVGAVSTQTAFLDLLKLVVTDPRLQCAEKKELLNELRKSGGVDRWTFRTATWILGAIVLLTIIAIWVLSAAGNANVKIPDGLIAIGSGAAGGLAGLLTPGRERDGG